MDSCHSSASGLDNKSGEDESNLMVLSTASPHVALFPGPALAQHLSLAVHVLTWGTASDKILG